MNASLLSIRGLRTSFPTRRGLVQAVDGVDLDVRPGECLGVVGESGSGKSVTFLSVLGLVRPPGRVEADAIGFLGRDLSRLSPSEMRAVRGREILPNILSPVIVVATFRMAHIIIAEASLSFLGLGVQPPTASWGSMVADGRAFLLDAWWVSTFPGLAILALVLAINVASQGLRDAFDPRLAR